MGVLVFGEGQRSRTVVAVLRAIGWDDVAVLSVSINGKSPERGLCGSAWRVLVRSYKSGFRHKIKACSHATEMLKTLGVTVRQGKIERLASAKLPEGDRVLVTVLPDNEAVDCASP